MKKTIRLSESELHRLIKESVKRALSEGEAWANQPPIDEFHPDWWYYRQEVEPEGLEDFDPCMDLSDEEYEERLRQEFGESKLRKVIRESVKQCLTELDWKTYMSAAQKRKGQGDHKKAWELSDYANQQFRDKYDINNAEEHENGGKQTGNVIHNGRTRVNFNGGRVGMYQFDNTGAERYHQKSVGQYQSDQDEVHDDFPGNTQDDYSHNVRPYDEPRQTRNQRYLPMSNNFRNKLNTMTNDMFDFYNGQSKYVKGKGWQ